MVKVYELSRYDALTVRVIYFGQTLMIPFKGGDGYRNRARFTTTDMFVQDALEHDARYGKLFTLVKKYDDTPSSTAKAAVEKTKPRRVPRVKTVNDALLYFTQLGARARTTSAR